MDDQFVVILVEDGDEVVDQTVLPVGDPILPEVSESDVLLLWFDREELLTAERLDGETERRKERNRDRFEDIAERLDDPGVSGEDP